MTDVLNIPKLPDEDDTEGLRAHLRNGISAILQNSQVQLQPDVVSNQKDSPVHIDVANQVNPFAVHEPLYVSQTKLLSGLSLMLISPRAVWRLTYREKSNNSVRSEGMKTFWFL